MQNKFEMTHLDYTKAKSYLEDIGRLDEFLSNNTSLDGYSLIAFANSVYEIEQNTGIKKQDL